MWKYQNSALVTRLLQEHSPDEVIRSYQVVMDPSPWYVSLSLVRFLVTIQQALSEVLDES